MDAQTGDEVGPSEIIKGYEVGKGHTSRSSPQHTWEPRCEKAVDRRHHNFSYERPKDNISIILLAERKAFTAKIVNRHEAVEAAKRNGRNGCRKKPAHDLRSARRHLRMMWSVGETPQPAATGANSMVGMGHCREAAPSNSSSLAALHSGLEQAHEAHAGS